MPINLNSAQSQAVEYLAGPLLVLAGPGTGKTQLLSSKVAHILAATDANPDNILCLTFTEAGATNMRNRLLTLIGQAAHRVNIHTYHAFGSDLLARYKNYATSFSRNFDAPIDPVTQFKIVQDLRAQLPAFDIMRAPHTPTGDILEVIQSAKSHRLTAADLTQIAEANLAATAPLNAELAPILATAPRGARYHKAVEAVYQPLLEVLTRHISPQPILKNIEPEANFIARSLNDALAAVEADPKHSVKPLGAWRDQHFEKDADGNFRLKNVVANQKLASIARLMAAYDAHLQANNLYDFNDMIEETINILKTDTGFRLDLSERFQYLLLDEFQDTNPSQFELVRLLTDYEKPCIMAVGDDDQAIYAFQGANASNLIDFQEHYGAKVINLSENYRSTAEILALSQHISEQITDSFAKRQGVNKVLTAKRNRDILGKVKGIPAALVGRVAPVSSDEENGPISPLYHKTSKKSTPKPEKPEKTHITRQEFISPDAEYYWVAQQIRALLDAGADPCSIAVLAPRHKLLLPIIPYLKAADIDIAYEKRDNILEDAHIKQLLTLAEFAHDLANERNPSHRLLEILAFPFWEVPALEVITALHHARQGKVSGRAESANGKDSSPESTEGASGKESSPESTENASGKESSPEPVVRPGKKSPLELLIATDHLKLQQIATFLAGLVAASFDAPLELFLDYLIGTAELNGFRSPYLEFYTGHKLDNSSNTGDDSANSDTPVQNPETSYTTFELYDHLSTLREAIRAHTHAPRPTLADLITFTSDYTAADQPLQSTSPYQDSSRSVQVMTAHKSKGLEFKHVFLTSVDDKSWGNASGNRNLIVLPKNLTHLRHTGDTENECLRLFFVAITRAELSLTLTSSVKSFTSSNLPRLQYLNEYEDEAHQPLSPYLPQARIQTHYSDLDLAKRQTNLTTHWISAYQQPLPELRPILEQNLEHYRLTATDLTNFIDLRYAGPANFYHTRILGAPRDPASVDITLGNLIHATFEAVTSQGLSNEEAQQFFREKLAGEAVTASDAEYLMEKGAKSLEVSLREFGGILRAPHARAEVNLQPEHPNLTSTLHSDIIPLTGKIDHLALDPEKKTIEVYDFKTGTFHPQPWGAHDSLYRYSLQLGFYKLLLNLSPAYQNYTVTRGHILYVTPDSSGRVYDKVYDYPEKDELFLKDLVSAIYHQVKSLNFVENPELFLTADANRNVFDLKKFAGLVISASREELAKV